MADSSEESFTVNCNACEREGELKKAADYCRACREYMCRDCLKSHNRLAMTRDHKDELIGSQPFIDMAKSRTEMPSTGSSRLDSVGGARPKTKSQPVASSREADEAGGSRSTGSVDSCASPGIRVDKDEHACLALGSCPLEDGGCLVTDCWNQRLKRLDSQFDVVECLDLPACPWAVCSNSTEAAVSLPGRRTIAVVTLEDAMAVVREIQVRGVCMGVALHRGKLVCGVREEGDRRVLVHYRANGEEEGTTVLVDEEGRNINNGTPRQMAVCGGQIYVAAGRAGLLILTGEQFQVVKVVKDLSHTFGVCAGEAGNVFVCGREREMPGSSQRPTVVKQYNKYGEFINTIISEEQLKQHEPQSVSYIGERSILVVTLWRRDEIFAIYLK